MKRIARSFLLFASISAFCRGMVWDYYGHEVFGQQGHEGIMPRAPPSASRAETRQCWWLPTARSTRSRTRIRFAAHAGHKVTITGTMDGDTIKVDSVKM